MVSARYRVSGKPPVQHAYRLTCKLAGSEPGDAPQILPDGGAPEHGFVKALLTLTLTLIPTLTLTLTLTLALTLALA